MGPSVRAHSFAQLLYSDDSAGLWLLGIARGGRAKGGAPVVQRIFHGTLTQVVQLFILTTLPLLLPPMPDIAADRLGVMQGLFLQYPLILTLCVMLVTPQVLGTSVGKALGTAGSMAGGTIVAVSTVASRTG